MRRTCAWQECRKPFETAREDARFCSNNCRAKANKAKHRVVDACAPSSVAPAAGPSPAPPPRPTPVALDGGSTEWPDQGDYRGDDTIPKTPVGRIARLEERLKDMEEDFDGAKADWDAWERARPKVEALIGGKLAVGSAGPSQDQLVALVRAELHAVLNGWRERILGQDQTIATIREEVDRLARVASTMRAPPLAAPPSPANGTVDKRVVAKIAEFEGALEGVRERLDAVEGEVAEIQQYIVRAAGGGEDEDDSWVDEDEDDDAA
jgi:hypothetical protein